MEDKNFYRKSSRKIYINVSSPGYHNSPHVTVHDYVLLLCILIFFLSWRYNPHRGLYFTALYRALASSLTRFHDHTQRRATFGRTPLNE